jgi:hypothetical protein
MIQANNQITLCSIQNPVSRLGRAYIHTVIFIKFVVTKLPHCYDWDSNSQFALWANSYVKQFARSLVWSPWATGQSLISTPGYHKVFKRKKISGRNLLVHLYSTNGKIIWTREYCWALVHGTSMGLDFFLKTHLPKGK